MLLLASLMMWSVSQMRAHVNSSYFLFRKYLDNFLHFIMPKTIIPLYTMVRAFLCSVSSCFLLAVSSLIRMPDYLPLRSHSPEHGTMKLWSAGIGKIRWRQFLFVWKWQTTSVSVNSFLECFFYWFINSKMSKHQLHCLMKFHIIIMLLI